MFMKPAILPGGPIVKRELPGAALLGLALGTMVAAGERPAGPAAPPVRYRGWDGCRVLRNKLARVVIVPAAGARVAEFSQRGRNVLLVDPKLNGRVAKPGQSWTPWDGSQPDTLSPGGGSQLADVWLGRYKVTATTARSVTCVSRDNARAGIRQEKRFVLDASSCELTIRRRITNISKTAARWAFWERTLVPGGSIGAAPVSAGSAFRPAGWAVRRKGAYVAGDPKAANPSVAGGCLLVRTSGKGTAVALDASAGWAAAVVGGLLFRVGYTVYPGRDYPWGSGLNQAFYLAADRLEIEPVSPFFDVAPGSSAEWVVTWRLAVFGQVPSDPAALAAKVKRLARSPSTRPDAGQKGAGSMPMPGAFHARAALPSATRSP